MVVASMITPEARDWMISHNVIRIGRGDLSIRSATWDIPNQEEALRGLEYYLARIQRSTSLVRHVHTFLAAHDLALR